MTEHETLYTESVKRPELLKASEGSGLWMMWLGLALIAIGGAGILLTF